MDSQAFTHENEVIAFAPIEDDGRLFAKQDVWLSPNGEVRWDFIMHNGKDWHFAQKLIYLSNGAMLSAFKYGIKKKLEEEGR
ncbi:TPA: hypothetical protein ACKP07_004975 [Serratia marcescens]|uniref:hypothetical protein n=1 Tax=Serratia marcescens TaxID=615 RepID=UPI00339BA206